MKLLQTYRRVTNYSPSKFSYFYYENKAYFRGRNKLKRSSMVGSIFLRRSKNKEFWIAVS